MKLVVGLGNPGKEYERTRHNVGFMLVDRLSTEFKFSKKFNAEILQTDDLILIKPQAFMNRSGEAVRKIVNSYQLPVDSLYVIHDDLDIPLGKYKIQKGKGPKEHRGILSIEMALGSKDFWRIRVGIDNRELDNRISGEEYTLQNFTDEERKTVARVIDQLVEELCSKLEIG